MFISRKTFEDLLARQHEAIGRAHALQEHNTALKLTQDVLLMRLAQSEHERAQLIHNYTGVKITVPSIEPEQTGAGLPLNDPQSFFSDMGDDEAAKQGMTWEKAGEYWQKS